MPRPADPALPPSTGVAQGDSPGITGGLWRLLGAVTLGALAVITLIDPGATRMYAWPWSLAYAAALLAPALQLLLRAFNRRRPLALPSAAWCAACLAVAAGVLASALASPHRGPALCWSAPLLAGIALFFVGFDWLQANPDDAGERRERLLNLAGIFLGLTAVVSVGMWLARLPSLAPGSVFAARNPFPLWHSNYTAGLALLMLPCFVALATRVKGARRAAWVFATLLALTMLLTSGSRGGFLGLAVLGLLHLPAIARALRVKLGVVLIAGAVALGAFVYLNPRTRAAFQGDELSASNLQRAAMATAGWRMGEHRPFLGWGPGTTPLVYPRFRAGLSGGAENVLQLHSTPVQLWAELGGWGILSVLALAVLALRAAWTTPAARGVLFALGGYAVFSLTDWQFDVPVFVFACALAGALLAPAAAPPSEPKVHPVLQLGSRSIAVRFRQDDPAVRRLVGLVTVLALTCIGLLGRRDPAPFLNTRALELGRESAHAPEAIALLRQSLTLDSHQEIAHFNLGWLLVVREPAAARRHFLSAAQLVPDKGGVYLGLGLAQLNLNRRDEAARWFALECLNDPAFLVSPWWRVPGIAELRENTLLRLLQLQALVIAALPPEGALVREARYVRELSLWIATGAPVTQANTAARTAYFAGKPAPPLFDKAPGVTYRRDRIGYPVLMRNLDLPTPTDLFDVQENSLATGELGFLFPAKGWLASPLLPALLADLDSPKK